jgi:hypothetical protein
MPRMSRHTDPYAWDDIRNSTGQGELRTEGFSEFSSFGHPSTSPPRRQQRRNEERPLSRLLLPLALMVSLCSFALVELAKVFRG